MRGWWRARSLRWRLIAVVTALLAAALLAVGITSTVLLRERLVEQVDAQLAAAVDRAVPGRGGGPGRGDLDFILTPGTTVGTIGMVVDDTGRGSGGLLTDAGELSRLTDDQVTAVVGSADAQDMTTVDVTGLGAYRVAAADAPGDDTVVIGLPLDGVQTTLYRYVTVEVAVAALVLAVAAVTGGAVVRLTLRPLRRVAAIAGRVAELPLDRGEVALAERVPDADADPRTEVGQVGMALNRMLGHVESALSARHDSESQVRRFVADASHELRTPLAAIRGYAEFSRRSGEPVPADIARAMSRIEAQATRMGTLVEDLLLLARLDAGRPLERVEADLVPMLVDAVGDAHVAAPGHRWRLDVPDEPVVVTGDPERLTQVVTNLLANAARHTPAGTAVTAGIARDGDVARITVADDGPGIPEELMPDLFRRFARGDASRSRDGGGTGLGLAIADAVVRAHGGVIEVASRPGATRFSVVLPAGEEPPAERRATRSAAVR